MACRQSENPSQLAVKYPAYYYPPGIMRSMYGRCMWLSVRSTMKCELNRFRPDCIVSYWTFPDGAVAIRAARKGRIPCAVMVGGSDILLLPQQERRKQQIVRVLKAADAVIPVGVDLMEKILRLGIHPEKVHIVPRGIDANLFSPGDRHEARHRLGIPDQHQILLFVGNMVQQKGIDVLLAACEQLLRKGSGFQLYLIGDGPLRSRLEAEAYTRGLASVIRFVGLVPHPALRDWYRAANLTVLPSRSEGVPNVLRESLACGTPFVASHVGGIPELADDSIGTLVPPENPSALAEGILHALATSENAMCHTKVKNSWDDSAKRLTAILATLV